MLIEMRYRCGLSQAQGSMNSDVHRFTATHQSQRKSWSRLLEGTFVASPDKIGKAYLLQLRVPECHRRGFCRGFPANTFIAMQRRPTAHTCDVRCLCVKTHLLTLL